jgi:hypothetical protein
MTEGNKSGLAQKSKSRWTFYNGNINFKNNKNEKNDLHHLIARHHWFE